MIIDYIFLILLFGINTMCHTRLTKKNKLCKIKSETQVTKTNVT